MVAPPPLLGAKSTTPSGGETKSKKKSSSSDISGVSSASNGDAKAKSGQKKPRRRKQQTQPAAQPSAITTITTATTTTTENKPFILESGVGGAGGVVLGEEERKIVEDEKPALKKVLEDCRDRAADVREKVEALALRAAHQAQEEPGPREEGASFLAAKQMLLLSYCQDLCAYVAAKGRGEALEGGGSARRLLEVRTVMEKLRPMDRKLKYQTDKLLKLASTPQATGGGAAGNGKEAGGWDDGDDDNDDDPLSFRPRPEAMAPWGRGDDETESGGSGSKSNKKKVSMGEDKDGGESGQLYRAPKMSSVPYDEDGVAGGAAAAREEKRLARRRERLGRGEVMETVREEFGDQPEAVRAVGNAGRSGVSEAKMKRLLDEDKERLDFEEDHMVRLTVTRKAKKARARMEKDAGRLETIADVGNAADFVRVARDADGFGAQVEGQEDDVFGGSGRKKKHGQSRDSSKALGLAMGAVGRSMRGGGGGKSRGKGKRSSR